VASAIIRHDKIFGVLLFLVSNYCKFDSLFLDVSDLCNETAVSSICNNERGQIRLLFSKELFGKVLSHILPAGVCVIEGVENSP
jgi:hypothetical protein